MSNAHRMRSKRVAAAAAEEEELWFFFCFLFLLSSNGHLFFGFWFTFATMPPTIYHHLVEGVCEDDICTNRTQKSKPLINLNQPDYGRKPEENAKSWKTLKIRSRCNSSCNIACDHRPSIYQNLISSNFIWGANEWDGIESKENKSWLVNCQNNFP